MITLTDLHVHTKYCDGKSTPEEMVIEAINKGVKNLGIVVHSYVEFDKDFCLSEDKYSQFIEEIANLKSKYQGKINLYCGIELDYYSTPNASGFDYVIGAVHYLEKDGEYYSVDLSPKMLENAVNKAYNGSYLEFAKQYYSLVSKLCERPCDIIAHFDLLTKFNDSVRQIDTDSKEYKTAWKGAVDKLLPHEKYFEINTGGIARAGKKEAYPSNEIIEYIKSRGGKFILSSDAHQKNGITFAFNEYEKIVK